MSERARLLLFQEFVDLQLVLWDLLFAVITKRTGSHGGARRPQGADQELQPLLLQQLQSGKKAASDPAVELVGS